MEYYGKILCISYNDLTYDDRPVMVNGKADYSRSRTLKGVHPSTLSEEELAPIMSIPNYKKLAAKEKINVVRSGRGLGGYVLAGSGLVMIKAILCHYLKLDVWRSGMVVWNVIFISKAGLFLMMWQD